MDIKAIPPDAKQAFEVALVNFCNAKKKFKKIEI